MIRQCVKDKIVEIISSEDMGGLPMVGENDAGIMRLYDKEENVINEYWITVTEENTITLERIV